MGAAIAGAGALLLATSMALAGPPPAGTAHPTMTSAVSFSGTSQTQPRWQVDKSYVLGVNRYQLDHDTKLTGWRLNDRWYFGRQKGLDSGLTLVWQKQANQVSVSKDGLRLTRRF